jgi:hypothetical protein
LKKDAIRRRYLTFFSCFHRQGYPGSEVPL